MVSLHRMSAVNAIRVCVATPHNIERYVQRVLKQETTRTIFKPTCFYNLDFVSNLEYY